MRKLMLAAVAAMAFSVPSISNAQFQLGLRVGYAPSMGDASSNPDLELGDFVSSQIPIQVDAMYQVIPNLKLGAYFSYGFGQAGDQLEDVCDAVDCSISSMRLGIQGVYSFSPVGQFTPWAGLGTGYEWANVEVDGDSGSSSGFEFVNLQLGGDYKVAEKFAVGPFVQFSLGQYSKVNDETEGFDKAMHQWLQFGIRGTFDL